MSKWLPDGVHLVGSAPNTTTEEFMKTVSSRLGGRLASIPDGEVGGRGNWVLCQLETFAHLPQIIRTRGQKQQSADQDSQVELTPEKVQALLGDLDTHYDTWAIDSYRIFARLREEGKIAKDARFQVCIPTPLSVIVSLIDPRFRTVVEPIYKAAQTRMIHNMQAAIPHQDLLIQFDAALEFALLEDVPNKEGNVYGMGKDNMAWFTDVREGVLHRLLHTIGNGEIEDDVMVGVHLCYGDAGHKHFIEPTDTSVLSAVAERLLKDLHRKIDYIHLPVPQARDDDAYFEPLKAIQPLLNQNQTHLFLGLVHADDYEGTQKRINTARRVLGDHGWGIATECGLARTPNHQMDSILGICNSLSRARQPRAS